MHSLSPDAKSARDCAFSSEGSTKDESESKHSESLIPVSVDELSFKTSSLKLFVGGLYYQTEGKCLHTHSDRFRRPLRVLFEVRRDLRVPSYARPLHQPLQRLCLRDHKRTWYDNFSLTHFVDERAQKVLTKRHRVLGKFVRTIP